MKNDYLLVVGVISIDDLDRKYVAPISPVILGLMQTDFGVGFGSTPGETSRTRSGE